MADDSLSTVTMGHWYIMPTFEPDGSWEVCCDRLGVRHTVRNKTLALSVLRDMHKKVPDPEAYLRENGILKEEME